MKEFSLPIVYAYRILSREWRRFVLPLLSLTVTAVVLLLILLLTRSSELFLREQSAELLGGDLEIESVYPVKIEEIWNEAQVFPSEVSNQVSFSTTIVNQDRVQAVSMLVVDNSFPLYGEIGLESGEFVTPQEGEIYLSQAASDRMGVTKGETVNFGTTSFVVKGVVVTEPASLLGGFRFLPRVFIGQEGFVSSGINTDLLRAEYEYRARFGTDLTEEERESLQQIAESRDLDLDFADDGGGRLVRGLGQVTDFLMIAVIATAVLATVNVYASTVYLVSAWRKSFAVLMALGLNKRQLMAVVSFALYYIVLLASAIGTLLALLSFTAVRYYGYTLLGIDLPWPELALNLLTTILVLVAVSLGSLVPALQSLLGYTPRQVLMMDDENSQSLYSLKTLSKNTFLALLPLSAVAVILLDSLYQGLLVLFSIVLVYVLVATLFYYVLGYLYRRRERFGFITRIVLSEKKAEGVFGVVSFTSLFVGLLAVSTIVLTESSLESYLSNDLSNTVPSVYVLDVQPSQKEELLSRFSDLTLFPNIAARINRLDNLVIEEELAKPDTTLTREMGREFSLTFGSRLPDGEKVIEGDETIGLPGTVSVDAEFATRANIKLGSTIEFTIQGVPLVVTVTNLRETDSRSGLPFFYFILSPDDLALFPAVYFGYAYYESPLRVELGQYTSRQMPNVSVLDTAELGPVLLKIVGTLLLIVYVIAIPPLLIAVLLIATLIVLSYANRRREGARLRALGATVGFVRRVYLIESSTLTIAAMITSYLLAIGVSSYLVLFVLDITTVRLVSTELLIGAVLLISLVSGLGYYLFTTDRVPLRQLLAYEDGH